MPENSNRAVALNEETLALQKERLGADHPNTLLTMNHLAVAYMNDGKLDWTLPACKVSIGEVVLHRGVTTFGAELGGQVLLSRKVQSSCRRS